MGKSKIVSHIPWALATLAAMALAASNAKLRLENAELKDKVSKAEAISEFRAIAAPSGAAAARPAAEAAGKAADAALEMLASLPLAAVSAVPIDSYRGRGVSISFSPYASRIKPPEGTWTFKVEPEVGNANAKFYEWDSELAIIGDFEPERTYTVTLNAGWSNGSGAILERPARLSFKAPKARPSFAFATEGKCYWPAVRQSLKLPYTAVAITNLNVTVRRAYGSNIPLFGISGYDQDISAKVVAEFQVPVAIGEKRHERVNGLLDIGAALGKVEPGIYFVDAEPDAAYDYDSYWNFDSGKSRVFAFTDLALRVAKEEGNGRKVDVFVNTFSGGEPVAGAEVSLMTAKHQLAAKGKTGGDGIAHLEISVDDGDGVKYAISRKDGDVSVLEDIGGGWSRNRVCEGSGDGRDGFGSPKAFLFSEREICRPGEKFASSVFARTAARDGARAFAGAPATLTLRDADGKAVGTKKLKTDSFGFASTEWEIPANAGLGVWRVECDLGDSAGAGWLDMRVANYVPDRISAEAAAAIREKVGLDAPFAISGKALYYFGEPLSGGFCRLRAEPRYAAAPKHLKGWKFGTRDPLDAPEWTVSATVADDGTFAVSYPGLASNGVAKSFAPVALAITANVQEPGGPSVSARDEVIIHPTPRYVAMREREGEGVSFDVAILPAIAGEKAAGAAAEKIEISLEREEWSRHYVKKDGGNLEVEWKSEMIPAKELARTVEVPEGNLSDWMAAVSYPDDALENGHYRLTAKCGDDLKTSFDFWHWAGEAGERSSNPAKVMLETDAEKYAPGDTATLSFASPFPGFAYVTAGVAGIDASFSSAVTQGVNKVSVAMPASVLASRYYASVTLVSADGAEARRLSGMAAIKIDCSASRKLDVALDMPELARPGEEIEFALSLSDARGNPVAGQVAVLALDEGVAALTGFHVADPFAYFFGRDYGAPFSIYDCYNAIYPELKIMPDGTFGGDGVSAAKMALSNAMLRNVEDSVLKGKATVRLILPPVEVGTNGTSTVKASMPDHTGALRFMAVAASETSAGSAEETVRVHAPISVLATAPRFAVAGDRFTITATIFNHDAEEGDAALEISLPTGLETSDGGDARIEASQRLAAGKSAVVRREIAIAGDASGALEIPLRLRLGDHEATAMAVVNVRPQRPVETHAAYGIATNGVLTLDASADEWIGRADTTLMLSASPAFALAASLAWLGEYPYGCLEQTVSCAFPFVAAGDLLSLGLIDDAVRAMADAKIALAYARILQLRRRDGFAMWPWAESIWTEGSLYAAHFIFEAAKTGAVTLDPGVRRGLVEMLEGVAENARPENRENAAYAAYVLALAGELPFVNAARNILSAGKTDWASFLAAAAMMRGGFASEGADAFAEAVKARAWEDASERGDLRRAGMALFVAAKSGLRNLEALAPAAMRLVSSLRSDGTGWGTTSDNAWATLGLAAYSARLGSGGARGTFSDSGEKRPFDITEKPASFTVPAGGKVSIEADGPVFASLTTVGVPARPSSDSGAISVSRRYVDSRGREVSSVEKGELVTVVIEVRSPFDIENAVIVDMVPGGFEIEDDSFRTRSSAGAYALPPDALRLEGKSEKRNDRWIWFGRICAGDRMLSATYSLRAVTPGRYRIPATSVEDMYEPDAFGRANAPEEAMIEIR